MASDPFHRLGIQVTPEQRRWLRQQGFDSELSVAAIVRLLIDAARRGEIDMTPLIAEERRRLDNDGR